MEAFIKNLVDAIGWSLLHSLWQGAIIYAILFIVLMVWSKMSSRLKHNLAFGSLVLTFSIFCITFFSIFELPQVNNIKAIALNEVAYQDLTQLTSSFNFKTEAYFPVVVTVYIIGIIFQLAVLLSSYLKLKTLKKASKIAIPEDWRVIFDMTLFQLKINKKVKFYLSENVNVPLVIGFLKPVVLFPFTLATQLDAGQVEAILIHELSHIRRNDYLINLFKTFIETVLFFNPFVWLTTKFIHIEREHACDDLVVKATGTPLTYAHALLKLEQLKDKQTPALSLAATGKNQHLYQRIKRITNMKTNYINAKQQFFILTLAIATVASLAWINPSKKPEIKVKKKTAITLFKSSALEDKALNNDLIVRADTDTVKAKFRPKKSQIIITGDDGSVKTYNSVSELPDSLRKKVERQIYMGDSLSAYYNSPEWKSKMAKIELNAKELEKKFNSKEWKDQIAKIEFNAKEVEKKFNSKEWKDQMAKIEFNAKDMEKKFNSKEWKDNMAKIEFNAKEIEKKFNSPEWKKKMEDYKKLHDSPEYKELQKKFENDVKELKKQKGMKDDKAFLIFDGGNLDKLFTPLAGELKNVFASITPLTLNAVDVNLKALPSIQVETTPMLKLATPLTIPAKVKVN